MTNKFKKRARALSKKTGMKYEAAHRASQKPSPNAQEAAFQRYWDLVSKAPVENAERQVSPEIKRDLVRSYVTTPEGRIRLIEAMRSPVRHCMLDTGQDLRRAAALAEHTALYECVFAFASDYERPVLEAMTEAERASIAMAQEEIQDRTAQLFQRDTSRLPTDWTDYIALLDDMREFARENREHIFMCADDPGLHHNPPRIPRLGFTAYLPVPYGEDERSKTWTIPLSVARGVPSGIGLHKADERHAMLEKLVRDARRHIGQEVCDFVLGELLPRWPVVVMNIFDYANVRGGSRAHPDFEPSIGRGTLLGKMRGHEIHVSKAITALHVQVGKAPYHEGWVPAETVSLPYPEDFEPKTPDNRVHFCDHVDGYKIRCACTQATHHSVFDPQMKSGNGSDKLFTKDGAVLTQNVKRVDCINCLARVDAPKPPSVLTAEPPLDYTNEQSLASSLNGHGGLGWPINEYTPIEEALRRVELHRKIGRTVSSPFSYDNEEALIVKKANLAVAIANHDLGSNTYKDEDTRTQAIEDRGSELMVNSYETLAGMLARINGVHIAEIRGGELTWVTFYEYGNRRPDNWGPDDEKCVLIHALPIRTIIGCPTKNPSDTR